MTHLYTFPPPVVDSKCFVRDCPNPAGPDIHGRPGLGMRCEYHRSLDPRSIEDTSDGGPLDEQWAPKRRRTWQDVWSDLLAFAALVFIVAWLLGVL